MLHSSALLHKLRCIKGGHLQPARPEGLKTSLQGVLRGLIAGVKHNNSCLVDYICDIWGPLKVRLFPGPGNFLKYDSFPCGLNSEEQCKVPFKQIFYWWLWNLSTTKSLSKSTWGPFRETAKPLYFETGMKHPSSKIFVKCPMKPFYSHFSYHEESYFNVILTKISEVNVMQIDSSHWVEHCLSNCLIGCCISLRIAS